jgi:hypothetical protein
VLAAAVDGLEVVPEISDSRRMWLPLGGPRAVRQVQLRWQYDPDRERPDLPRLELPNLEGTAPATVLRTVRVPAGFTLRDRTFALKEGPARSARLLLERAAVQDRIVAALAEMNCESDQLARKAALERLALFCRLAEQQLELAGNSSDLGPDGQPLGDWLLKLKARSQESGVRGQNSSLTPDSWSLTPDFPTKGTPYSGVSRSDQPVPAVMLLSQRGRTSQRALAASAEWLGVLALAWLLTVVPYLPALARLLWPEQLLLLAGALWLAGSTEVVAGPVFLLGLVARLWKMTR